jgi:hypothetical protein
MSSSVQDGSFAIPSGKRPSAQHAHRRASVFLTTLLLLAVPAAVAFTAAPALARPAVVAAAPAAEPPQKTQSDADAVILAGRQVAALIARQDGAALAARFTPEMALSLTQDQLQTLLNQWITGAAPLGAAPVPRSESVRSEGAGIRAYLAEYPWRIDHHLAITVAFAPGGTDRIAGLYLRPALANPAVALAAGRLVDALIVAKDVDALEARFTPDLARLLPPATLRKTLEDLFPPKRPLGTRLSDTAPDSVGRPYLDYTAVHPWRSDTGQTMSVAISLEAGGAGRIAALLFQPGVPPDPRAGYRQHAVLRLPFAPGDAWFVLWGGNTREQNYHVAYPDQRHAFDFVAVRDGRTFAGDGKDDSDYFDWGRSVVAPAAGRVVETVDGLPDNVPGQTDAAHPFGNYIVLDLGNREYAVFAHLQNGSISVQPGEAVRTGAALGRCGNSGNTVQPHLHFHLQDRAALTTPGAPDGAVGLPATFTGYLSGGKRVAAGSPVQGETVANP